MLCFQLTRPRSCSTPGYIVCFTCVPFTAPLPLRFLFLLLATPFGICITFTSTYVFWFLPQAYKKEVGACFIKDALSC